MRTRLATLALLPLALVGALAPAAAYAGNGNPGGNNGTVKIDGGDAADDGTPSNDPHVGCTFAVEWFGYDAGSDIISHVSFAMQAPTASVGLTVDGDTTVFVGGDAAGGGTDLDGHKVYTLHFTGAPQAQQGYHVKLTVNTPGSNGSDKKSKVFWVTGCDDTTTPTTPGDNGTGGGGGGTGGDTGTGTGGGTGGDTGTGGTTPVPFSWDWTYADPSCTGLDVTYPADIPDGQANDANIRVETDQGQVTLNYHLGEGTWSGEHSFDLLSHPAWPAGVTSYQVTWTQVGGTNYHWQGSVPCVIDANGAPQAVTQITGWRTSTVSVSRGSAASADSVNLAQADNAPVVLQSLVAGRWTTLRTVVTDAVDARVTFPTQTRKGTFQYRLAVPRTAGITGATTKAFTVRVY